MDKMIGSSNGTIGAPDVGVCKFRFSSDPRQHIDSRRQFNETSDAEADAENTGR